MPPQAAWRTRCRRRSNLARPYIWRLRSLSRVTWPSVCPLLYGSSRAARTAASCWSPVAKRFRSGRPLIRTVSIQLRSSLGVRWRTIWGSSSFGYCCPIHETCVLWSRAAAEKQGVQDLLENSATVSVMKDTIGAGRCFADLRLLYKRTRQVLMAHQERPIYAFHW